MLAVGADRDLFLWDVTTGKLLSQAEVTNQAVRQLLFTPDGKTLAINDATSTIVLWDAIGNKKLHELKGRKGFLTRMALSPDGKTLASGSWQDSNIRLWDIAAGKEKFHFPAHDQAVIYVAYSPDGKTLASFGNSDSNAVSTFFSPLLRTGDVGIRFWDSATGKKLREIPGRSPHAFAYFPDGKTMVALEYERKVQVYDAQAGKPLREYDAPPRTMSAVAIAPGGKTVATFWGGSNTFDLWDATGGKLLHSFAGHRGAVAALAFAADGQTLFSAAADRDSRLGVWDPATGALRSWLGDNPNGSHALGYLRTASCWRSAGTALF